MIYLCCSVNFINTNLWKRAHLGICDLTITEERRSAVDFSLPFMTLGKDKFNFSVNYDCRNFAITLF